MTFTKLFSSITASTIWAEPDHTRLVWITMLAMADQRGRVWASIPGLANMARVTIEKCEEALGALSSPDKYSRTKEHEGRRIEEIDGGWRLLNHAKYREIRDEESIKQSKRDYINKRRAAERVENVEQRRTESNTVERSRANTEAYTEAYTEEEKKKNTKRVPRLTVQDLVSAGVDENHARDWMEIRRLKKQPLTQTAWAAVKTESEKAGLTIPQAIAAAAASGWGGFKASWLESSSKKSQQTFRERDEANARAKAAAWSGGILGQDQNTIDMEAPIGRISSR